MKQLYFATLVLALALAGTVQSLACTNVIVTKGASVNGTTMVSYAADSHQLYGELYFTPAAKYKKGDTLSIHEWDTGRYLGHIAQVEKTYQTVGNMNQHQLIIAETTFGGREELANPDGIMDYGSAIYITLQRAKTAREAISTIDALLQEYGYPSAGETFSIADKDEAWIMEIVGKGKLEKGAVWVAIRIPDGCICAHANCSRIHHFPLNDSENCLYSPDVISFARKAGYFDGADADFSFCDTYCPADQGTLRGCEGRAWSAFRLLSGNAFDADKYLDFAMGYNKANKMPLYVRPENPVSLHQVAEVMRDHFEGTPMDFSEDVGAGPHRLPYRWRPMDFEIDGKTYGFERSIATQQTGFWFIATADSSLPDEVGAKIWFGVDDAATSALTPIYANIRRVPECFAHGNGNMMKYSPTSAFWLFNRVAHFAYLMYDRVAPEIRSEINKYESENEELVAQMDQKLVKMVKHGRRRAAARKMTKFCRQRSEYLCRSWREMSNYLLVKYMDGNVKWQNEDGSFKDNGNGANIPEMPQHPQFRERWLRSIVLDHGSVMEVKE